jgi:hypothetical protein
MASPADLFKADILQNIISQSRTPIRNNPVNIDLDPPPLNDDRRLIIGQPQAQLQQLFNVDEEYMQRQIELYNIEQERNARQELERQEQQYERERQQLVYNAIQELHQTEQDRKRDDDYYTPQKPLGSSNSNNPEVIPEVIIDSNNPVNPVYLKEKRQFQFTPNMPSPKQRKTNRLSQPMQLEFEQQQNDIQSSQQRNLIDNEVEIGDERDSDLDERIRRRNEIQFDTGDEADMEVVANVDRLILQHQDGTNFNELVEKVGDAIHPPPKDGDDLEFNRHDYERKKYFIENTSYHTLDPAGKRKHTLYKQSIEKYERQSRPPSAKKDLSHANAYNPNHNDYIPPEIRQATLEKKQIHQTRAVVKEQKRLEEEAKAIEEEARAKQEAEQKAIRKQERAIQKKALELKKEEKRNTFIPHNYRLRSSKSAKEDDDEAPKRKSDKEDEDEKPKRKRTGIPKK